MLYVNVSSVIVLMEHSQHKQYAYKRLRNFILIENANPGKESRTMYVGKLMSTTGRGKAALQVLIGSNLQVAEFVHRLRWFKYTMVLNDKQSTGL